MRFFIRNVLNLSHVDRKNKYDSEERNQVHQTKINYQQNRHIIDSLVKKIFDIYRIKVFTASLK